MSWAQRDAERMEDHSDEITRLEADLTAMQEERNKALLDAYQKHLDIAAMTTRAEAAEAAAKELDRLLNKAEVRLGTVETVLEDMSTAASFGKLVDLLKWVRRLEAALATIDPTLKQRAYEAKIAEEERLALISVVQVASELGLDPSQEDADSLVAILRDKDKYLNLALAMQATRNDWSDGTYRVGQALSVFKVEVEQDKEILDDITSCLIGFDDGRVFRDTTWNYDRLFTLVDSKTLAQYRRVAPLVGD